MTHLCDPDRARREAMSLLAKAHRPELEHPLSERWSDLAFRPLRAPEVGLVMLRARMGGDGAAFNLGEATMSRAVVELESGERGYGQVLGRDAEHARLSALLDALFQRESDAVERYVLAPIRARLARETAHQRAQTSATKVDFFTLVRGED
jgi:alpha-D-ribose 1-methylphosphonate 5-triphosphate synthase subunit PhnG